MQLKDVVYRTWIDQNGSRCLVRNGSKLEIGDSEPTPHSEVYEIGYRMVYDLNGIGFGLLMECDFDDLEQRLLSLGDEWTLTGLDIMQLLVWHPTPGLWGWTTPDWVADKTRTGC